MNEQLAIEPIDTAEANRKRSQKMKGNTNARKSGVSTARSLLKQWGTLALDRRLLPVQERDAFFEQCIEDAGGRENLSEIEIKLRESLADEWLIFRSIGLYILSLPFPALVNKRKRSVQPIVMQYNTLANSFHHRCREIGVKRIPRPLPPPHEFLQQRAARRTTSQTSSETIKAATEIGR